MHGVATEIAIAIMAQPTILSDGKKQLTVTVTLMLYYPKLQ